MTSIVLITGGNRGIGYGVARKLAKDYPDYKVIIGSRDPEQGREAVSSLAGEGLSVSSIELDVTSDDSISAAKDLIEKEHGHLDVLMNNAGIALDVKEKGLPMRTLLQRTFDVNVFGAAAVTETFIPLLEKSSNPRIVFTSSIVGSLTSASDFNGYLGKSTEFPSYRSSKSSLNMLMLHYASLLRDKGFKVNAACPGYVGTNLNSFHGTKTIDEGALNLVRLAVLDKDGENGTYSNIDGAISW